jgi:hypothetical protein
MSSDEAEKSPAKYSLLSLRESKQANQSFVTITRDGKVIGEVAIKYTSTAPEQLSDTAEGKETSTWRRG